MRICLIGATQPCHNPRLVREADTLAMAGHHVRVVAPSNSERMAAKDHRLMARRPWRYEPVDVRRSLVVRGRRKAAGIWHKWLPSLEAAEMSYLAAKPELIARAEAEPADWFIAHAQAALPVAASAAQRHHARLGFDCEDLLSVSTTDPGDIVEAIESRYLPGCDYVSVPSAAIGRRLQASYDIAAPLVLYNVFPLSLARGVLPPAERPAHTVRLHWFSQTIGPGRGIEDAVRALPWLGAAQLHLRGSISPSYRAQLNAVSEASGAQNRVFYHPQIDHDDLIGSLAAFDVGLSLERPDDPNYSLTVTNKVFSYLLAGLPVVATRTAGHLEALERFPSIAGFYDAGDPRSLADCLARWMNDTNLLRNAQQAAWSAARAQFCWDAVSDRFLAVLSGHPPLDVMEESRCAVS